jgi:hypothetical protein
MGGMKKVTFKWPLIGAALGALAWLPLLYGIGAIENGAEVGHWKLLCALTPTVFLLKGFWWSLGSNCLLYAGVVTLLRFVWIRMRYLSNSNWPTT